MNAWLITWEGKQTRRRGGEKIVAILSSRKSENEIVKLIQLFYLRSKFSTIDNAFFANRPNNLLFTLQKQLIINNIPHGDRLTCGTEATYLYARLVNKLDIRLNKRRHQEIITWVEQSTYKWKDNRQISFEPASTGRTMHYARKESKSLSADSW